ncbi:MAG: hypothetical protein QM767_03475 [Anaeromyxobacter sp.]
MRTSAFTPSTSSAGSSGGITSRRALAANRAAWAPGRNSAGAPPGPRNTFTPSKMDWP